MRLTILYGRQRKMVCRFYVSSVEIICNVVSRVDAQIREEKCTDSASSQLLFNILIDYSKRVESRL